MQPVNVKTVKFIVLPLWVASLFAIGLMVFTRGFLLTRIEMGDRNSTADGLNKDVNHHNSNDDEKIHDEILMQENWKTFDKAMLIVIDGLRYDFMYHNHSVSQGSERPFQNKFIHLHKLIETGTEHARIFKFIADPPTTTMQRVKAITTG